MVNKNSGRLISFGGESAFKLGHKASLSGFHSVDGYAFTRVRGFVYFVVCCLEVRKTVRMFLNAHRLQ
jgi:hypothetical protein